MVQSKATSVRAYLADLPPERRNVIAALRKLILRRLPTGYREAVHYGMICYEIPLSDYPDTSNGQPLVYVCLAAQKNHFSLYLMCAYMKQVVLQRLRTAFAKADLKLDMGKSCIRFRRLADLPLDAIGDLIASATPADFIAGYEAARRKGNG